MAFPALPLISARPLAIAVAALTVITAPAAAKDSLGVFGDWGAFRDPQVPRCYAIAMPTGQASGESAFVSVGTWPKRQVRGQIHVRLSRRIQPSSAISLSVGGSSFTLTGAGSDAWAASNRDDAAIVAAIRSASSLTVTARDASGKRFTDRYTLSGAPTAMDAATVGCAKI